jgi:hypothetical protein
VDKTLPLRADQCDILESSGNVNPLPSLPNAIQELFKNPANLFCHANEGLLHGGTIRRDDKAEYCKLVARQLRSGKVTLRSQVVASASVFPVGK